ncbi:serine carboxypeptidase-like 16 [Artemisia annua]|uniref:Serine carboxypeptidase-like 16 n=1 Tax=Artemisia annua TaxID=35608 RepID=A0A2U1MCS2_ARTAN|nr:serine carboxypeptidase-like 16 [Artemisia annua]
MECGSKIITFSSFLLILLTLDQSHFIILSHSKSIVTSLPGYPGELPFKLETGYVGIGENEEAQFFYYFVESERNPEEDPLIFYLTGGPGCSAVITFFYQIGPLSFNFDNAPENITLTSNPNSWTKMASVIYVDMPAGVGFSYATTKEASISSDSIVAKQANDFLRKFLIDHPKFLSNPLYISGISYMGIVTPVVTLEVYNANERGDQPALNIQGYILCSPLTDKFMDFNSRIEYAHRMALISDDIYKSATENCGGNYINPQTSNSLCIDSLQRYEKCTSGINMEHILEPLCDKSDVKPYCREYYYSFAADWANDEAVQQALSIRQGTIGTWEFFNTTMHYVEDKNDTFCYSYDIHSSFSYHKKLASKNCRALIFSGDHDMTFPYVGIEQWIVALGLSVDSPWKPFYVNDQVGGYEMRYTQNNFSLTFATVKGAGHSVAQYKPEEALVLTEKWLALKTYSVDSM